MTATVATAFEVLLIGESGHRQGKELRVRRREAAACRCESCQGWAIIQRGVIALVGFARVIFLYIEGERARPTAARIELLLGYRDQCETLGRVGDEN